MDDSRTNLILRDDTFLGICAAIGEDFGFDANWLRVPLALGLLWNPAAMFVLYFGAGVIVLFSRLIAPNPRRAAEPAEPAAPAEAPAAQPEIEAEPLPIAA